MIDLPWFFLICPLAAAVLGGVFLRRWGWVTAFLSTASVFATLGLSLRLLGAGDGADPVVPVTWIEVPGLTLQMGLVLDGLSLGMMFVVTLVGALVHLFSWGYMADDGAKGRYFAALSLFMFSMTGIVLADNFVMMFVFWELVGVSSYLLIGHYDRKDSAAEAAKKAFLTNRIGDFGFMIGILMVWGVAGTVVFGPLEEAVKALDGSSRGVLTVAALLVFCGAVGKSAQVPLHVWLPDAMEGPTPVSALIHAATMVAAGVYMLVRSQVLVAVSDAGEVIAWIGCVTAAFAALVALQQNDIKKILAYSTLSQLGYMVMAVGLHAFDEAMFHLYTHAFFKALLFLGAGAVIHACHHEQDIWKMGGLSKRMGLTFATFVLAGTAALVAVPGTSGYASKEAILEAAHHASPVLFWTAAAVAFLTPFYMTRLVVVAFFGKGRGDGARHAHEVSPVMWAPLVVLAGLSWVSHHGFVAGPAMARVPHHGDGHGAGGSFVAMVSLVALLGGIIGAAALYWGRERDPVRIPVLAAKFWIDEGYGVLVKTFQDWVGHVLYGIDQLLLGGAVVTGGAKLVDGAGRWLRRMQTGNLQTYGLVMGAGVLLLVALLVAGAGGGH
jgi:NADH-quinone oxidoreductase subunit L